MLGSEYYNMDLDISELTKIITNRIKKVEPDNVVKIMGCIFLKEDEQEMLQLAYCPEATLLSKIADSKAMLWGIQAPKAAGASSKMQTTSLPHYSSSFPPGSHSYLSMTNFHQDWESQLAASDHHSTIQNLDFSLGEDYSLRSQTQFLNLDDQLESTNSINACYYQSACLPTRTNRRSPSLPDMPFKACHYFYKGYCKHGANCRYFHGPSFPDGYTSQMFCQNVNEMGNEDHRFLSGSLEKLEIEITELLKSKRGSPVSIASLPMLYYEKYGRHLQAEGYLTESQRHGKAGFSLTELLARLNSIHLIDR